MCRKNVSKPTLPSMQNNNQMKTVHLHVTSMICEELIGAKIMHINEVAVTVTNKIILINHFTRNPL